MRGCLKALMIILTLGLMIILGLGTYYLVINNPTPTRSTIFEIIIYGCSFILCGVMLEELFKWRRYK